MALRLASGATLSVLDSSEVCACARMLCMQANRIAGWRLQSSNRMRGQQLAKPRIPSSWYYCPGSHHTNNSLSSPAEFKLKFLANLSSWITADVYSKRAVKGSWSSDDRASFRLTGARLCQVYGEYVASSALRH